MYIYEPTTNTHLINKHFAECKDEQFIIQKGSQGASKTVSDLMLIIDFFIRNTNREISIVSAEKTKLMDTAFNDLKKIMLDWNIWDLFNWNDQKSKLKPKNKNTGFIEFIGLDTGGVGKGRRRDLIYINECDKITHDKFFDIQQRAKKVIMDFNPERLFWIKDYINNKNLITLTFEGNEKLPKEERLKILNYKELGFNPDGSIKNEYYANKWGVFGLGEWGSAEGRVFTHFTQNTFDDFVKLNLPSFYGIDWGKNHGFGIIWCKYDRYTNTLYCHELNSKSENKLLEEMSLEQRQKLSAENGGVIIYTLTRLGVPKDKDIICDSAVPDNIELLQAFGWDYAIGIDKPKGSVMSGISLLQSTNLVYTKESKGIENDFLNYQYAKDRLGVIDDEVIKLNDDCIDPIRYVRRFIRNEGIG